MMLRLQYLSLSLCLLAACGGAPPEPNAPNTATTAATNPAPQEVTAESQVVCDLVCEQAKVAALDTPDHTAKATANANQVLDAMHPDLLACYAKRVAVSPAAHASMTVDIVVAPDGHVQDVETTGGALLGEATMSCIVSRVKRATFEPPRGGGTMRIHVPFSLRPTGHHDDTL